MVRLLNFLGRRFQQMPRRRAMRWGERIGNFVYTVSRVAFRRPHRYAHRNLRLTEFPHPEASAAERDRFIRQVFIHFTKSLVDFLRAPTLSTEEMCRIVRAEGVEHLHSALARGKGVLLITAHIGNWEMLGRYIVHLGCPLTVVAREPENPDFAAFVHRVRESGGYREMYRGSSTVREMLTLLKRNEGVGLLPDQNSGDLFIPFFGVPAGTVAGPASLALHTGAALLPCYCVREPDDTYRLIILPPTDTAPSDDKQADSVRIMTEVNRILEDMVRQYPEQWLWIHNRWKSAFEEGNRARAFPEGLPDALAQRWTRDQ
ncbi:MAG: lauroyl acyltransferase [Armatimonadaceae bacterium]